MEGFTASALTDELFSRIDGLSYKKDCVLPREELRYLTLPHMGFDGKPHTGEMIVNRHIAERVLKIFKALYAAGYPIEKIRLVDEYGAVDEPSMADNNSSAFNYRCISFTDIISKHGYGMAVDINTLFNPYVKTVNGRLSIEPANAGPYVDRTRDFPHKIDENDLCYRLFREQGFLWGGSWQEAKDYQHFEMPAEFIRRFYPDAKVRDGK